MNHFLDSMYEVTEDSLKEAKQLAKLIRKLEKQYGTNTICTSSIKKVKLNVGTNVLNFGTFNFSKPEKMIQTFWLYSKFTIVGNFRTRSARNCTDSFWLKRSQVIPNEMCN